MASAYDTPYDDPSIDPSTGLPWGQGSSTQQPPVPQGSGSGSGQGIAPPWWTGTGPVPFAPGTTWADVGPQTDPQGNSWSWDANGGRWVQGNAQLGQPTPPPSSAPPPVNTGNPGGGGTGPVNTGGVPTTGPFAPIAQDPFQAPTPTPVGPAPTYTPPAYTPPPAFSYGEFNAPSYQEAQNDPGYQFAQKQGEDALKRNYAMNGIGDSGTAYKGLIDYGQSAAATQYNNVFGRDLSSYQANRANAVDNYNTNYGTQYKDPWTIANSGALQQNTNALQGYQTQSANTQYNNGVANTNSWNAYLQDYLAKHNNQLDAWNRLYQTATAG